MATIKPIEARSVHQIQSGQVIVDLCSVVKELVENSLDAGSTTIEVRFKNNGLDTIEVQDNGDGISPTNYETVALKHYTSKLSSYEDLGGLQTFGFRGEALSSLCALSRFHILTAQAEEAPKGKRLDFEISGRLKGTQVVACQKGTIATVEGLFETLPVRRKELTKNIKREYNKVIGLLQAYACISTGVKFTVKSSMPKGKSAIAFSTRGSQTTKENIANVYGAKTLTALLTLELELEYPSSTTTQRLTDDGESDTNKMIIRGHISRPVFGEGRQTPDRQMFFVNSRPCGLPQIAKAINEVYKSFNFSQSPFIFADLRMDTNSYDVNVSPDKRTILIHDSANLVESLKGSLLELFEHEEHTVPQSQLLNPKLSGFRQLTIQRQTSTMSEGSPRGQQPEAEQHDDVKPGKIDSTPNDQEVTVQTRNLLHDLLRDQVSTRPDPPATQHSVHETGPSHVSKAKQTLARKLARSTDEPASESPESDEDDDGEAQAPDLSAEKYGQERTGEVFEQAARRRSEAAIEQHIRDFNTRTAEEQVRKAKAREAIAAEDDHLPDEEESGLIIPRHQPNAVQNAFDRMRPKRSVPETATITMGNKTITTVIGSQSTQGSRTSERSSQKQTKMPGPSQLFGRRLRGFAAPGTQFSAGDEEEPELERQSSTDQSPDDDMSDEEESAAKNFYANQAEVDGESPSNADSEDEKSLEDEEEEVEEEEDDDEEAVERQNTEPAADIETHERTIDAEDEDYMDEEEEKAKEQERVAELVRRAEEQEASAAKGDTKRAANMMKNGLRKDSNFQLMTVLDGSIDAIEEQTKGWHHQVSMFAESSKDKDRVQFLDEETAEERLSLTVSKSDFSRMRIVGQFNLGFVLAVRPAADAIDSKRTKPPNDELFIIDQHASDEKYNFERLQTETVVGNQRLVRPKPLELTAVEEEIILDNMTALEKNGFLVEIDTTGNEPVGQRCRLASLPLSKEVVFDTRDLEELIHLLSESSISGTTDQSVHVPRPSKVRKMFAMRACRSSIMIGKTLTMKQMSNVVGHMGDMDKPWNCPHGRPTMRHLTSLNGFETWVEGDGLVDEQGFGDGDSDRWASFMA